MALKEVGYYTIARLLGEGGMGAVYEGCHAMTGRRVAVKTLRASLADREDLNARFFNEARTMSFLSHPSIAVVHDVGRTSDGTAYMVMELCHGPTLGAAFKSEPRIDVRIGLIGAIAAGIAHAHGKGVIHRDLKPDNVIVTRGLDGTPTPKVLDFGIAKVLESEIVTGSHAVKTRTGSAMGTPLYMSPEQCRGASGITPATDVYALGVMLWEAVAGRTPFDGGVGEVLMHHLSTPAPALPDVASTLPDGVVALNALCAAMLDKEATARPSMLQVVDALAIFAPAARLFEVPPPQVQAIDAYVATMPEPSPSGSVPSLAKRPRSTIAIALGGALAGVVLVLAMLRPTLPPAAAPPKVAVAPPPPRAVTTWTLESDPSGADILTVEGTLVGRTPLEVGSLVARGQQTLLLHKDGFEDELARYSARAEGAVKLRAKPRPRAHGSSRASVPPPKHDDFDVAPLH